MTRNRDDFTTGQAFMNGIIGACAILALMVALGSTIAANKADADMRAAAMGNVIFTDDPTHLAAAGMNGRG